MVEAQLLLELLVRLLARPARLDRRRQLLERRVGRQVREVVLPLARGAGARRRARPPRRAGAGRCGAARPRPGAPAGRRTRPRAAPWCRGASSPAATRRFVQHGLGRDRLLARHRVLARAVPWPPSARAARPRSRRRSAPSGCRPPRPRPRSLRPRRKAALIAVAGVGQHAAEADAGGEHAVDLGEREVGLGQGAAVLLAARRPGRSGPGRRAHASGRNRRKPDRHRDLAPGQGERDQDLAVSTTLPRS